MKNSITVSIKTPCPENWQSFSLAKDGRFCNRCQKTVVDLTKMSERELLGYLRTRNKGTCTLMRKDQLATYHLTRPTSRPRFLVLKAAAAAALLMLMSRAGHAQVSPDKPATTVESVKEQPAARASNQNSFVTVSGRISDEFGQPMAGANIILQGTAIGTATDGTGYFTFPQQLQSGQTLLISFIGYETREYRVKEIGSDKIDIEITMDVPMIMGELITTEPYAIESQQSVWSRIKSIF